MTTVQQSLPAAPPRAAQPVGRITFDYGVVLLCGWFLFGLFLDGWAHNHGFVDDTFFTPWHAVLYSGYGAVGLLLVGTHFRNVSRGAAWGRALPPGYMLSLAGVLLFGAAGAFDFAWHELFGFEANMEALLSPAHLLLAVGAFLFLTGPLRAYWLRRTETNWRAMLPFVLALAFVASLLTFFLQYAALTGEMGLIIGRVRGGEARYADLRGVTGILLHTATLTGVMLFAVRRWRLPFGAFTLIFALNMALMTWMLISQTAEFLLIVPAALAGLVADLLLKRPAPITTSPLRLRALSFAVPFALALGVIVTLHLIGLSLFNRGVWWAVHMWLGAPFLAGIGGIFLSYLLVPPALPEPEST
jgi:hypothetical protein